MKCLCDIVELRINIDALTAKNIVEVVYSEIGILSSQQGLTLQDLSLDFFNMVSRS